MIYHYLPQIKTHGNFIQSSGVHYQLFNLKKDPFEQNDLATTEPEKLRSMMQDLIEQTETYQAKYPITKEGKASLKPEAP